MRKKLFIIPTALVLIMGITACGNTNRSSETGSLPLDNNQQTETEAENVNAEQDDSNKRDEQDNPIQAGSEGVQIQTDNPNYETEDISMKMNVQIGDTSFIATLENNVATSELMEIMREAPISISMSDYSGFEKVGSLGRSLTTDNHQTTTSAGDIVLYNGNQIVMFYGSNSWSYTRIGKIDDLTGWEDALGSGSITAVFSLVE